MRSEEAVSQAIEHYASTVKRICFIHLKNEADTEDICQTVFLKYAMNDKAFESEAHEKAWIIRVTINACKDLLKSFFRKHTVSLDAYVEQGGVVDAAHSEVLEAVLALPEKYRRVVYLHYYEGYPAADIADILRINVNTVYTQLTRAKTLLRNELGGEA
ncbi:MAG: sigma-70 family RNA polymerase sigma factor [Peptococcaceae bacterium]|nr:sigma-70 family RNA polymerase sigma factor [Peptococcaceae bacterium]